MTSGIDTPLLFGRREQLFISQGREEVSRCAHNAENVGSTPTLATNHNTTLNMEQTIENKVAEAILEKDIAQLAIEGNIYRIAPPSIATLILVSEIVSTFPIVEKVDKEQIVYSVLHNARHFKALGELVSVLILGAKGLTEERVRVVEEKRFYGLIRRKKEVREVIDKKNELAKLILENVRPSVIFNLVIARLTQNGDKQFFRYYHFPVRGKHSQTDKGSGALNDSIWATVLGIVKTFGVTEKYALYDISYLNAIMYSRVVPMPRDTSEEEKPLFDEAKDMCNPDNFSQETFTDEEIVRI